MLTKGLSVPTILLVEDAEDLAKVVLRELKSAGYNILYAETGEKALEIYPEQQPDLVILDWMLPGIDGLEVLRRLRASSSAPVLMLTARAEELDRVLGLEIGADDYLTKPFSMRELLARIRAILRRIEVLQQQLAADRASASNTLRWKELTLDPEAHTTSMAGELLDLSPTEFELLHLMLRNPGRAFSRSYLLDAVWGEGYIQGDRSVDNAVLRLRRKLGSLGDGIETVWGVGYRLRAED
jgi:DNA-binding response OmpR family regulator